MDLSLRELRKDLSELPIAHERLAADNRHVQRAMAVDERHEARHQLVALVVSQPAQRHVAAKMIVAVGVASGASQRALFGNLDRDVRAVARKNAAPCLNQLASVDVARHSAAYYLLLSSLLRWQVTPTFLKSCGGAPGCTDGASSPSKRSRRTHASSTTRAS